MNAIDDPVIPEDLADLLRTASRDLAVAPAALRSVERRARQRRRRRRSAAAGGAAAIVLAAGLVIALVDRPDTEGRTVLATAPPTTQATQPASVPQPLLVRRDPTASEVPPGTPEDERGGVLESVTATGSTTWWVTSGEWHPVGAYVLADGRRFGIAATMSTGLGIPPKARLDEIGARATTLSSRPLELDVPWGSFEASIRPIGATGNEIIVQRDTKHPRPLANGGFEVLTDTAYSAVDVDSGAERPLFAVEGQQYASAAAGDVLVRTPDGGCQLAASTLTGRDARMLRGACTETAQGTGGRAYRVALSPDGRYAAVLWSGIPRTAGPSADLLDVVDLEDGSSLGTEVLTIGSIRNLTWTGVRALTALTRSWQEPISMDAGPVTVRSIVRDAAPGTVSGGD